MPSRCHTFLILETAKGNEVILERLHDGRITWTSKARDIDKRRRNAKELRSKLCEDRAVTISELHDRYHTKGGRCKDETPSSSVEFAQLVITFLSQRALPVHAEEAQPTSLCPPVVPFSDLSEDVHESVLLCLWGNEAAAAMTAAAPLFQRLLAEEKLWKQFACQEFPTLPSQHSGMSRDSYRILHERQRCKALKWKRLPCHHRMGSREGSPGMFARHGHLFVFGGWGHGPVRDLHVGKLTLPICLYEVPILGNPPPATYEMKVTVLDDDAAIPGRQVEAGECDEEAAATTCQQQEEQEEHVIRVVVSGGYKYGGYHGESGGYGVIKIRMPPGQTPCAEWERVGQMPRELSNHSATFVPPRTAGPNFPAGYLLLFGGNDSGDVSNSIDLLDLATFKWVDAYIDVQSPLPSPRNSHSATLLQVPFLGDAVLVVGGGTGCSRNGSPPRGGHDLTDSWWLSGLTNGGPFRWTRAPQGHGNPIAAGRGHVACRLDGTGTVLTIGGGLPPRNMCVAFDLAKGGLTFGGECHVVECATAACPRPRAFGAGCALPGGSVLVYGGWHPSGGTFSDFWLGHADRAETELFKELPQTVEVRTADNEMADPMAGIRSLFRSQIFRRGLTREPPWQLMQVDSEEDDSDDGDAEGEENDDQQPETRGVRMQGAHDEHLESDDEYENEIFESDSEVSPESIEAALETVDAIEASWEIRADVSTDEIEDEARLQDMRCPAQSQAQDWAVGNRVERILDDVSDIWAGATVVAIHDPRQNVYDIRYVDDGSVERRVEGHELRRRLSA